MADDHVRFVHTAQRRGGARGSHDNSCKKRKLSVGKLGTIAYLITLDNGFTVLFRDSAGDVTDFERAAIKRGGRVDVAIVALANIYLNTLAAQKALEYVHAYRPGVFMPAHHDAP